MWDEFTYPNSKFNGATLEVWEWISKFIPHFTGYVFTYPSRPHFYQTRSAWSVDQGSNKNHSPAYNFTPTVTKFCVMWEGLSLPHDTKFGNCRCKIVDSRSFHSWSLIHGLRWSGLIKVGPGIYRSSKHNINSILLEYYIDVIMSTMAFQITSLTIVYSTVYSGADQRKLHQSSASLAFVRGIHRSPMNPRTKGQ